MEGEVKNIDDNIYKTVSNIVPALSSFFCINKHRGRLLAPLNTSHVPIMDN